MLCADRPLRLLRCAHIRALLVDIVNLCWPAAAERGSRGHATHVQSPPDEPGAAVQQVDENRENKMDICENNIEPFMDRSGTNTALHIDKQLAKG
ncbi:hypothetical protein NDU88_006722 [Pleurodeles waltl]|uniref:Secreted protein n=1 Tax=Pleurodeles waltl TaxID=8319 RepID=A0AAV7QII1_PLEWA|nr:hypothetical protein NDU88_006722 [Pleurodeles waltl]